MLGSASVDLAGVATGRVGVFLQANLHPWDWFPGAALVLGAGGTAEVVELDGNRWQVAGNAQAVRARPSRPCSRPDETAGVPAGQRPVAGFRPTWTGDAGSDAAVPSSTMLEAGQ